MAIMIAGTSSHAGKSVLVAALCRILSKRGYAVTPFKAQNMSLNSFVTKEGKEIAIAQAFQAKAAGIEPNELMNPVLLKPKGNLISQLIVLGEAVKDISSLDYYKEVPKIMKVVEDAYRQLAMEYDVVVIEGAGGMAEINLYDRDVANIGIARIAKPSIYIVGDIDRGGVFASLYGTYRLLPHDVASLVRGFIINRLRGSEKLLESGIRQLEEMTGIGVIGVLPYISTPMPSEDSLCIEEWDGSGEVGVLRLPRVSNFTDFEPIRGLCRFVDLKEILDCEVLIVPGSKDTISDLKALKSSGMDEKLRKFARDRPVIGICGGYQMLGRELIDYGVEYGIARVKGVGLVDAVTEFREFRKICRQVKRKVRGNAVILDRIRGKEVWGYEIHKGVTKTSNPIFDGEGCASDDGMVWGTYMHGLFWNDSVVRALCKHIGVETPKRTDGIEEFAKVVEEKLDMDAILSSL